MNEKKSVAELSYEKALDELTGIVADLEKGEHSLDESVILFERGQTLAVHCAKLLKDAELKVREISESGEMDEA